MTQAELGKKTNSTQQIISRYLSGLTYPPLETFFKLAKIFNVTLYELTGRETLKGIEINAKKDVKLSPDQQRILDAYLQLDDDDWRKKAIEEILLRGK